VGKGFEIHKKTLLLALTFLISGLINVALNILLIPVYGYMGAGIAKTISYAVLLILGITISYSFMPWFAPVKSLSKVVLSTVSMGVVLIFLKKFLSISLVNLIILIVIGAVIYFSLLFLFNEIKKTELNFVKSYYYKLIKSRTY